MNDSTNTITGAPAVNPQAAGDSPRKPRKPRAHVIKMNQALSLGENRAILYERYTKLLNVRNRAHNAGHTGWARMAKQRMDAIMACYDDLSREVA